MLEGAKLKGAGAYTIQTYEKGEVAVVQFQWGEGNYGYTEYIGFRHPQSAKQGAVEEFSMQKIGEETCKYTTCTGSKEVL